MNSADPRRVGASAKRARRPSIQTGSEVPPKAPRALTVREREVMTMLAHGATGAEIVEALFISSETVRSRTRSAREKLGAKTRSHAIALAVQRGQIEM